MTVCNILKIGNNFLYWCKDNLFINKKPNYIFLNNLTAGSNNEYLTLQEYYGIKTPYRFFNLKKTSSFFKDYEVIFKSHYLNSILNIYGKYPQKNFRKKDRLGYPSTIILKKKL